MDKNKIKKVFGIGVNDSPEPVVRKEKVNGKWRNAWVCPYYVVWCNMLSRCYYEPFLKRQPTYMGCSVCDEWIYFMTFKAWMMTQDFQDKQIDKDILSEGNKVYSPETCRFVDKEINYFLTDRGAARGEWPIGVDWYKASGEFRALCRNPFTKKQENLGHFTCPEAAHEAWRERKHQHALRWADLQDDPDIAEALRKRFAPN